MRKVQQETCKIGAEYFSRGINFCCELLLQRDKRAVKNFSWTFLLWGDTLLLSKVLSLTLDKEAMMLLKKKISAKIR